MPRTAMANPRPDRRRQWRITAPVPSHEGTVDRPANPLATAALDGSGKVQRGACEVGTGLVEDFLLPTVGNPSPLSYSALGQTPLFASSSAGYSHFER